MKLNEIKNGEQFKFKGSTFTKLNDAGYCLLDIPADDFYYWSIFDWENNNYEKSVLRKSIQRYVSQLGIEQSDLTQEPTVLSVEEWKEYKSLIKPYKDSFWLRSGNSYNADFAYFLFPAGASYYDYDVTYSRAVRPAIYFNLDAEVEEVQQ